MTSQLARVGAPELAPQESDWSRRSSRRTETRVPARPVLLPKAAFSDEDVALQPPEQHGMMLKPPDIYSPTFYTLRQLSVLNGELPSIFITFHCRHNICVRTMSGDIFNNKLDRSFLDANLQHLQAQLTMKEKISLLAGNGWWETVQVPRLNIPSVKMTDGPNGARGGSFYKMTPATTAPSGTCLGATFSPILVRTVSELLAAETKARNAVCLLAPTINIARSPLGGRAFESFSEDPTVSGVLASAFIDGLQSQGVSPTIKHFVNNDHEHERYGSDSVVNARPLREIYLRPFQIATKKSNPWSYMTAYNKVNGTHASENSWLLQDILRKEWGYKGMIMSDWYGTYSVSDSINAGCNLEMPGPTIWRSHKQVNHLLVAHKIDPRTIDQNVLKVLEWVQLVARRNPEIVYAEPSPEKTRWDAREEDAKVVRRAAVEGIVLLKNDSETLPVSPQHKTVAVIGPNANAAVLSGGGCASLRAAWSVTPLEGLERNKPAGVTINHALGCRSTKFLPELDGHFTAEDGSPGFDMRHYMIVDGEMATTPIVEEKRLHSDIHMADYTDLGKLYFTEVKAVFTSPLDGHYDFGIAVTGQGWLWVDGELIIDASECTEWGPSFFGAGSNEVRASIPVKKGQQYTIKVLHDSRRSPNNKGVEGLVGTVGVRVGAAGSHDPDVAIEEAVDLAKNSDMAVLVVGLNPDWETEGFDRATLSLPGRQNELISRVAAVNPNTVVVLQGGSALSMPWVDEVASVVWAWYGGNETGNAIADVIYGAYNPSGRLPITLPVREVDIAAYPNNKTARDRVFYGEDIWVGYKHFNAKKIAPLFPFGRGLSYTTWDYQDLQVVEGPRSGVSADEWKVRVSVRVVNTGKRVGDHSVHVYLSPPAETDASLKHPQWTLQAFEKVYGLEPGASQLVEFVLDKYAVSHWDELWKTWRAELGEWTVRIGMDAQTMVGEAKFTIDENLEWLGL